MQRISIQHGERRCAVNIDAKLYNPPDPQQTIEGFLREPPISLAVVWPGQLVHVGEFVGAAHLHVKACESHPDAEVASDVPCIIVNRGPDAVVIESLGGRYRGMLFPQLPGEERVFPLNVFDEAEVFEIRVMPVLEAGAPGDQLDPPTAKCERVPCDMVDGVCPRCMENADFSEARDLRDIQAELDAQNGVNP